MKTVCSAGKEEAKMGYSYWLNGVEREFESRDEFIYFRRGFGRIETDEELIAYAEKATHGFYDSGWKHGFLGFYLGDYCLDEPKASMTDDEYNRLKALQHRMRQEAKAADEARCWKHVETCYYADNSVEEIWEDKDGIRKTVMTVYPHGDLC